MHGEGTVGGRGPGLPVSEEALALLVRVELVAGVGDACEGEHGRRGKPSEFGEGNGAEEVATRRGSGGVARVKAAGKLAVELVGAVDKAVRSGGASALGSVGGSARTHRGIALAAIGLRTIQELLAHVLHVDRLTHSVYN